MSIGEVLAHLRADFPDTTISKLRFLETEGLVEPQRTPAGYRKYSGADVARLRFVLAAQRDQYLPLRVIREQLAAFDSGDTGAAAESTRLRPSLAAVGPADPAPAGDAAADLGEIRLFRADLLSRAAIDESLLAALEQQGLIAARAGGWYDADALEIAVSAGQLAEYGLQPRHLRAYRVAADREIGLFTQLVAPIVRQSGPATRARASEAVRELATLTQRIQAALVRAGLRETLGR
ncbi:MAG TPA: MerR family transcriptional regulator [Micromonosporaceae bacterium]|nr:MerR family transcriptional regulator [Micromonosporaceae bacterium]